MSMFLWFFPQPMGFNKDLDWAGYYNKQSPFTFFNDQIFADTSTYLLGANASGTVHIFQEGLSSYCAKYPIKWPIKVYLAWYIGLIKTSMGLTNKTKARRYCCCLNWISSGLWFRKHLVHEFTYCVRIEARKIEACSFSEGSIIGNYVLILQWFFFNSFTYSYCGL